MKVINTKLKYIGTKSIHQSYKRKDRKTKENAKKEEIIDLKAYRGNKTIYHNRVKWLHLLLKME